MCRARLPALLAVLAGGATGSGGAPPRPSPRFTIDLDREPEDRFREVAQHFKQPILGFINLIDGLAVRGFVHKVAERRGLERNEELQAEIRGWTKYAGLSPAYAQAVQLIYELQTIMIGWDNVKWPWGQTTQRTGREPTFGCLGIIARSADDGTVTHARNMDFSFSEYFQNASYLGTFVKNGKEVYTAQMIAGYSFPFTAWRHGRNGYSLEANTRFSSNVHRLMKNLFDEKRHVSGWIRRQVLQSVDNFEDAVEAFSTLPYVTSEYDVISGVQKGVILARDPDSVYHKLTLGPNKNDYIIITNFDYWDHDFRERLDPTSLFFGQARRIGAERLLNTSKNLNMARLRTIVNDERAMAKDTILQAFMNVEKEVYESFLPYCQDCGRCKADGGCAGKDLNCCGERSHFTFQCAASGLRRCGCLPDGACRAPNINTGDEDCCSFQSYISIRCPGGRRCGTWSWARAASNSSGYLQASNLQRPSAASEASQVVEATRGSRPLALLALASALAAAFALAARGAGSEAALSAAGPTVPLLAS